MRLLKYRNHCATMSILSKYGFKHTFMDMFVTVIPFGADRFSGFVMQPCSAFH